MKKLCLIAGILLASTLPAACSFPLISTPGSTATAAPANTPQPTPITTVIHFEMPTEETVATIQQTATQPAYGAPGFPVIFDDDGSPDGTTALFYLLSHPEVNLLSISISYGEAHPPVYIQHIGRKLDEFGITGIPLGAGQDTLPFGGGDFPEWMRRSSNDFWGLPVTYMERTYPEENAAWLMIQVVNNAPRPVTIFISGPSTNLAQALGIYPEISENIAAVYIMGGAVYVPGNISDLLPNSENTVAEWNIYGDPQSARQVFESGIPIFLVPLDATNQVSVNSSDTAQWRQGGNTADFAADIYEGVMNSGNPNGAQVWDLMTAAIMVNPDLCAFEPLHLEVINTIGPTSGQTMVVPNEEPNVNVCLQPDIQGIHENLVEIFSSAP